MKEDNKKEKIVDALRVPQAVTRLTVYRLPQVLTAALRVPLVVTWLTVYRQLHIMSTGGLSRPIEAKLFMASLVFKFDVLRIYLLDRYEILKEPSSGIKESCPRSSGDHT